MCFEDNFLFNQSGAVLFSVGDHDLPLISILVAFSASFSPSIFSRCFPLLRFPSIIPVVTRFSSYSVLIAWRKKLCWRLPILFISDLVTVFRLVSLLALRFIAFSEGTIFLLPTVSFVLVLLLSRLCIRTSQFDTMLRS